MRVFCITALFLAVACVENLPPPVMPDTTSPMVHNPPEPIDGHGQLVVDVVDGPTEVQIDVTERVTFVDKGETYTRRETSRQVLCDAPCVTSVPYGRHVLVFPVIGGRRFETDVVSVGEQPTVYRRILGYDERPGGLLALGIVGAAFGGMALVTGVTLLPVGLASDSDGMAMAGGITLGAGALLTFLGVLGIVSNPRIEQRGAGIQFDLSPSP